MKEYVAFVTETFEQLTARHNRDLGQVRDALIKLLEADEALDRRGPEPWVWRRRQMAMRRAARVLRAIAPPAGTPPEHRPPEG